VACSTCHVILSPATYAKLPPPSEEEEDMLDLASGLTKTSRLGCQIIAAPELDGMEVQLPKEVVNQKSP
jgi:ferredoxin, 2Fe-2S